MCFREKENLGEKSFVSIRVPLESKKKMSVLIQIELEVIAYKFISAKNVYIIYTLGFKNAADHN